MEKEGGDDKHKEGADDQPKEGDDKSKGGKKFILLFDYRKILKHVFSYNRSS